MNHLCFAACVVSLSLAGTGSRAAEPLLDSLKATEERRLAAWSAGDLDTIMEIEAGSAGFGWASSTVRDLDDRALRSRFAGVLARMDRLDLELEGGVYRVVGQTGLVLGVLARKEQPKDGPAVIRRLRYSATYVFEAERWRLVQYHRSPEPDEPGS